MYRLKSPSTWDSRIVIDNLIDILELVVRVDPSPKLCSDLQLNLQTLQRWHNTPDADSKHLAELIQQTESLVNSLTTNLESLETNFADHYLLHLVRRRKNIVGGTSKSDLPSFFYWLQKGPKQRHIELLEWLAPLEPLRNAIDLNLYLIRNNAQVSTQVAEAGLFQTTLTQTTSYQLIQVVLPVEQISFPDIRTGRRNLTIKFLEYAEMRQAPKPFEQNINFELRCCLI